MHSNFPLYVHFHCLCGDLTHIRERTGEFYLTRLRLRYSFSPSSSLVTRNLRKKASKELRTTSRTVMVMWLSRLPNRRHWGMALRTHQWGCSRGSTKSSCGGRIIIPGMTTRVRLLLLCSPVLHTHCGSLEIITE